jgi:hypothetical protein
MQQAEVKSVIADGYERTAQVFAAGINETVWCRFIQHDDYVEPGEQPAKPKIGDRIEGRFSIQLVTEYSVLSNAEAPGFSQPIEQSSHIVAIGRVYEKIDDFTYLCDIGSLGDAIAVEFEDAVEIGPGTIVKIRGSLELETD